jgi:hypothetical protein
MGAAVEKVVQVTSRYEPDAAAHAQYEKLRNLHHELYMALNGNKIFEQAAAVLGKG